MGDTVRIIDAHVHLWERAIVDHPWLTPAAGVLDADFTIVDLEPHLLAADVEGVIVVQSADSMAETNYLTGLADALPRIAAVVGWLPLLDPAQCARLLSEGLHPAMAGIRHLVHVEADPDWLIRPAVMESLRLVAETGLVFEVPAEFPLHVDHVTAIAAALPALRIVVDHLAKPPMDGMDFAAWTASMRRLAARPNVVAKLSGLTASVGKTAPLGDVLQPVVGVALDAFGVDRLIFGSDWPVLITGSDYGAVLHSMRAALGRLDADELDRIFATNATDLYGLPRASAHHAGRIAGPTGRGER